MAAQRTTVRKRLSRQESSGSQAVIETSSWRGFHLFYHGDRDWMLIMLVRPLVGKLLADGQIDSFFFIRYALGGPHIRLRLRPVPGCAGKVAEQVRDATASFFVRWPSMKSQSEELIRRKNQAILVGDPLAVAEDDIAFPDNSVTEFPVQFEVDRYGGPFLLEHSLDFFAYSSLQALHFLAAHEGTPLPLRLSAVFRILVRHAWGLAGDEEEFFNLAGYAVEFMGKPLAAYVEQGDRVFEQRQESIRSLLRSELVVLAEQEGTGPLHSPRAQVEAARRLAREIRRADPNQQWFIAASQMHMTANRLGLVNPDEVYLGRMLWRATRELASSEPVFWKEIWQAHPRHDAGGERLHDLLRAAFAELLSSPMPPQDRS